MQADVKYILLIFIASVGIVSIDVKDCKFLPFHSVSKWFISESIIYGSLDLVQTDL